MTLKLNGSSSGYTAIDAPAAAGSNTLVLPADNGSNGEFLKTNGSGALDWAVAGGGKVLQFISNSSTTDVTSTGSEHVIVDATITPASASNKIFIIGAVTIGSTANSNSYGGGRIRRGDVSGTMLSEYSFGHSISNNTEDHVTPWVFDSPNTTNATTYSLTMSRWSSNTTSAIAYGTAGGGIRIFLVEFEG